MPRAAARHVIAPRLVRLPDAARYVSMGETKFCELVKAGVFPPGVPVGAMRIDRPPAEEMPEPDLCALVMGAA